MVCKKINIPCGSIKEIQRLVEKYEPILEFYVNEIYFPADVNSFIFSSDLWGKNKTGKSYWLANGKDLLHNDFQQTYENRYASLYLSVAQTLLNNQGEEKIINKCNHYRRVNRVSSLKNGSGLFNFLLNLSLLVRNYTPIEVARRRTSLYQSSMKYKESYNYYYRVLYEQKILILQYWYFYFFNDWRSGYGGINDHEGDWECITIYLSTKGEQEPTPVGIACSMHNFSGESIFQKWNSDYLDLVDDHPRIYVSGGSHANFFSPGRHRYSINKFGVKIQLPFIDYTDTNGVKVGYGCEKKWTSKLLEPLPNWVTNYRGYWGINVGDPFGGENGITGPMYSSDGKQRIAWENPLAWKGENTYF